VCAKARNLTEAAAQAYRAADLIEFEGKHLRRDIGSKALKRFPAGVKPNAIQDA